MTDPPPLRLAQGRLRQAQGRLRQAQGERGKLVVALRVFITGRADFLLPFHGEHQ